MSLLVFAGALALTGAILLIQGVAAPGCYALTLGAAIFLGTACERWRYRANDTRPGAGWVPTGERFQDPQSGKTLQVFYHPQSGERRYVSDSDRAPGADPQNTQ